LSDQSYGLRFDIYERVHLSNEEISIQELEEVELFPRIQVIPGDEYATLRGHLLLTGLYRGEDETRELSHLIPVEITVPLSRVNRLEDISVEIENFDVDLLNERSLNVTGVLSLQGIETASFAPAAQDWNSREFSVSYEQQADEENPAPWVTAEAVTEPQEFGDVIRDASIQAHPEAVWNPQSGQDFNHEATSFHANAASFYTPAGFETQERFGQDAPLNAEEQAFEQQLQHEEFLAFSAAQTQADAIPVWNFEAAEANNERTQDTVHP
jgi:stage VI sporulation protein D